ncbi:MAG: aminotransferase class IV [Ginsengibacter sp.]
MSHIYAVINGNFILKDEAKILISDLSVQRGYGIFDYFRTVNNRPVFLDDHLDRFYHSASGMNLVVTVNREKIKEIIQELMVKNNISDSGIRLTLTGGYSEDGYSLAKPNLLITQTPFAFKKENFEKGIRLVTYDHQRQLPQVKTIDYIMAIHLQLFIKENKADDVLYHNHSAVCECPRSNFFIVTKNEEVLTPAKNILKGITRKKILGFPEFNVKEADINLEDIGDAKEAFVTSTTKNVLPVLEIDGKIIGEGVPGRITTKIYERLFNLREKN